MKKSIVLIFTILFTFLNDLQIVLSQENANEGKRFLVTFPQNENTIMPGHSREVRLGIYISSKYNTNIKIVNHFNNVTLNRAIVANDFIRLDNFELGGRTEIEDISDGVISSKVIEITSEYPVSVSIINSKLNSSDGYLAYPVSEWGQNYIHNSLYHQKLERELDRSSGFTIISQEDNCNIKVVLKGKNENIGSTKSGNFRIGDTISVTLNSTQSYSIKTKSDYNNRFDLSGSFISANKKIGVISFHERTLIPQEGTDNGRDNLLEMQQPLSNWRNKFVSIDLGREYGDYFRVLPLKDNTNLTITNYNEAGEFVTQKYETINTGGGFYEFNNIDLPRNNKNYEIGIKGNTVWEADSPILVTQYSYSYSWDNTPTNSGDLNYDPFMINLINEAQFTKEINFLAPPYNDFDNHNINLVVKIDTNFSIQNQLKTIILDDKFLTVDYPNLLTNRIGNTEYFWLRFEINSKVHRIESKVPFAAFLYGFGNADSYGMQTALGNLSLNDTLIRITNEFNCENFDIDYSIKSIFGLNNSTFEPLNFKIKDFEITSSQNITQTTFLRHDSLLINIKGSLINPILASFLHLKIISESGKIFYDTLNFQLKNTIAVNKGIITNSIPGNNLSFEAYIDQSNDTLSFLNEYEFSIKYHKDWFQLIDILLDSESIFENITYFYLLDTVQVVVDIPISRSSVTDGNRLIIEFKSMLNKDTILKPTFIFFSKFENSCYIGNKVDTINTQICAQNLRLVQIIDSEFIDLQESLLRAFQDVSLSIYDYKGSLVRSNLFLKKEEIINLDFYLKSKGLYFIRNNNFDELPPLKYFHF